MSETASELQPLVDSADVPALLRAVDGCCATRSWSALVDLAARCRAAVELGKQLWAVAMHIEYRLAREAPGAYAAAVLRPGAARFALGPLTEVAASTHTWDELAPGIGDPASAATVAQERVLRGEDLRGRLPDDDVELPLTLQRWEPAYALPAYRDREALFPAPAVAGDMAGDAGTGGTAPPAGAGADPLTPAADPGSDTVTDALRAVVEPWSAHSEGRITAVAVDGDAAGAVAHLAPRATLMPVAPAQALAWLQWCGASGGAHGHRRGGAAGRFAAWWAAAALAGLPWPSRAGLDDFAAELGGVLDDLRWYRWSVDGPAARAGWRLHLAVEDPADDLAWAVGAYDRHADGTSPAPRRD